MTFKGSSNSMPSWTDADGGAGWINGRKSRQARVMRPRFNAGSIEFAGNKTWASVRFDCLISSRSPSGQLSESAAKGTEMAEGSTGTCGAGEGVGGATGCFGAPLPRGVMKLVPGVPGAGACGANCLGGGGVMALVAGAGACGMDCLGGGVVMLFAGSTPREANGQKQKWMWVGAAEMAVVGRWRAMGAVALRAWTGILTLTQRQ